MRGEGRERASRLGAREWRGVRGSGGGMLQATDHLSDLEGVVLREVLGELNRRLVALGWGRGGEAAVA